jgi:hypothetical protein
LPEYFFKSFVRLSRTVDVSFDYRFVSDRPASIRGGVALDAVLSDGAGWERTVPLVAEGPFTGPSARADGVLDLRRLLGIVSRVQTSTGASLSQVTVTVVPRIAVAGYAGDAALDEAFAPSLPFTLDTVSLRLAEPRSGTPTGEGSEPGAVAVSPLTPRTEGSTVVTEPAVLSLGPLVTLEVDRARSLAAVGILAALVALLLGAALLLRRQGGSEADRIEARHGSRVVRARATIPEGRWVTELQDVDALIRLAEAYDRVVLRVVEPDGGDAFLVDDGIALYRYRTDRVGALGTPRTLPAHGR